MRFSVKLFRLSALFCLHDTGTGLIQNIYSSLLLLHPSGPIQYIQSSQLLCFFIFKAFATHLFFFLGSYTLSTLVQFRPFSTSQPSAVWYKASALCGVTLSDSSACPSFSYRSRKSSVVIWFSGRQHNPCGYSSFRYDTSTIHVTFPSCFVNLKTQVYMLFASNVTYAACQKGNI